MRPVSPYMKVVLTCCSTYIWLGGQSRATLSDLMIYVYAVPTEHLDTFDTKLHATFRRIVKEGVDLTRMRMVIDRDERQVFHSIAMFSTFSDTFQAS